MKIIYHCYGGTHSSALGAALHLGILEQGKIPSREEILSCPYFDKVASRQLGNIFLIGEDERGHQVYIMGCKGSGPLVEKVLKSFCQIMELREGEVVLASTTSCLNIFLRVGGLLSRRLNLVTLGRLFLLHGSRLALPQISKVVETVKNKN